MCGALTVSLLLVTIGLIPSFDETSANEPNKANEPNEPNEPNKAHATRWTLFTVDVNASGRTTAHAFQGCESTAAPAAIKDAECFPFDLRGGSLHSSSTCPPVLRERRRHAPASRTAPVSPASPQQLRQPAGLASRDRRTGSVLRGNRAALAGLEPDRGGRATRRSAPVEAIARRPPTPQDGSAVDQGDVRQDSALRVGPGEGRPAVDRRPVGIEADLREARPAVILPAPNPAGSPGQPSPFPDVPTLARKAGPNEGGRHPGPGHSWRSTNTETPPSGPAPAGRSPVDSLEGRSPPRRLTSKLSAPMLNAAPVCVGFRGFTVPKGADHPGWARATSSGLHDRGEAFPRRCCRVGGLCAEQHVDDSSRGRTTRPRGVKTNRVLSGRERILIVDYKTPTTAGRSTGQEPPDVLSFSVKGNE